METQPEIGCVGLSARASARNEACTSLAAPPRLVQRDCPRQNSSTAAMSSTQATISRARAS
eukprot:5136721-Prymnesium_polylepis.3